jgi:hypothetical protein
MSKPSAPETRPCQVTTKPPSESAASDGVRWSSAVVVAIRNSAPTGAPSAA